MSVVDNFLLLLLMMMSLFVILWQDENQPKTQF